MRDSFNGLLVEICEICNKLHFVVVVILGPAISFCHNVRCCVSWHGYLFLCFSSNRCSVLSSYATCHSHKRRKLYLIHDCLFASASLNCYSAFELWEFSDFLRLITAVHRLCLKFTIR